MEKVSPHAWYVVFVLALTQALAFVDRQVLALLVEPIRKDLGASDTQMSLLYGLSFALFYVIVALPIARLADRSSRRNIIAAGVTVWSLATAACGLAQAFPALLIARMGVGAGEATLSPSAQSLLAAWFPPERLGVALGIFSMGIYVGGGLALLVGGGLMAAAPAILAQVGLEGIAPWRLVMVLVGLPGLAVAVLLMTLREPVRKAGQEAGLPLALVVAFVRRHGRGYFGLIGALSMMVFVSNGASAWIPAFFERRFGWDAPTIGAHYGPIVLICGAAGALAGGLLASLAKSRHVQRANVTAAIIGFAVVVPLAVVFPLMPTPTLALVAIGGLNFALGLPAGGAYAALQEMTPPAMRAQVTALNGLCVNLIGAGLGPLGVGLLTDHLFRDPARLPLSLALSAALAGPVTLGLYLVARSGHEAARLEAAQ